MSSELHILSAADATIAPAVSTERPLAVRLENVGKCYQMFRRPADRLKQTLFRGWRNYAKEFWALAGVNLEIAQGETVGIIGRNGSGKSTLLQIICGTLTPSLGRVETNGRVAALLELGAGFHPEFTGRENIFLNARIMGLSKEQTEARFDRIAAFADIGEFIERPVKTYSSGMYVRLAFSVIANVDADILIIDEALAVGDAFFTQKCMRFLRTFREAGTIIFVSHDAAAVLSLCERALWLDKGKPRLVGPAKAVNEAYLAEFFGELNRQRAGETAVEKTAPTPNEAPKPVQEASRAELPVTPIPPAGESFGEGGAEILGVDILDVSSGVQTQIAEAQQQVTLRIHFRALQALTSPIVGFYLKNRLGQELFGENTASALPQSPPMVVNEERVARFTFNMPVLQAGQYTVTAAVADGTLDNHTQHHWIHDAALLTSSGKGAVATGLVGLAMKRVEFQLPPRRAASEASNGIA